MADYPYKDLLIVIGGSAGGVPEILKIVKALPKTFQATVLIATHRDPNREANSFAGLLERGAHLQVEEPIAGEALQCTTIYVGKARQTIELDGREIKLSNHFNYPENIQRIDRLFESAAESAGPNAVGVVLSGTMWDGRAGIKAISEHGGYCIVQDPDNAQFRDMPDYALAAVNVDFVGDADEIADKLIALAERGPC